MDNIILQVEDVKKYFPVKHKNPFLKKEFIHAVDNVSFKVERGQTFGLVGESGCGKSTLSRVIMRLQRPTGGRILLNGQDINKAGGTQLKAIRRQIQMVFQNPYGSLNPRMTVQELIEEPMVIHRTMNAADRSKEVARLLDLVGLNLYYKSRYPHEFSGGQRQRIGIARALALKPEMMICDEPVSALDVSIQAQILNLLKDLQKELNLTCLFISHNLSVVKYMSQVIAVMYLGKFVEIADSADLYKHPKHPYTQALLSAIPDIDEDQKNERIILTGDVPSAIEEQSGCVFRARCWRSFDICKTETPALVDTGCGHMVACHLYQQSGTGCCTERQV